MSKWMQFSREFLGDGDLKLSNEDALKIFDAIEADCAQIARLTQERDDLREIIHDAVGPTVAWASEYQTRYELLDLHPQHQALIDRMTAAVNTEKETG